MEAETVDAVGPHLLQFLHVLLGRVARPHQVVIQDDIPVLHVLPDVAEVVEETQLAVHSEQVEAVVQLVDVVHIVLSALTGYDHRFLQLLPNQERHHQLSRIDIDESRLVSEPLWRGYGRVQSYHLIAADGLQHLDDVRCKASVEVVVFCDAVIRSRGRSRVGNKRDDCSYPLGP